jgi:VanZ family protein
MMIAQNAQVNPKPVTTKPFANSRLLTAWVPAMLGLLIICGESTRVMGADHTMVWLSRLCMPLIHLANSDMVELNHVLRKCGHFFGYGTLGFIFAQGWLTFLLTRSRSLWAHATWARTRLVAAGLAVLSTAMVASMDEIHQSFLPNRTACVSDVLLDTSGAVLMLSFIAAVLLFQRRRALQERLQLRLSRRFHSGSMLFRQALLD